MLSGWGAREEGKCIRIIEENVKEVLDDVLTLDFKRCGIDERMT
jgi:hypothetical protein